MKTDISRRKLAESAKQLRAVQREQSAAFNTAHAKDVHKIDRGDGFTRYRTVGGYDHDSSHVSVLQRKLKAKDGAETRGTDFPTRTLLQKQIKQNPATRKE